jgi:hypothetical protein
VELTGGVKGERPVMSTDGEMGDLGIVVLEGKARQAAHWCMSNITHMLVLPIHACGS